MIESCGNCKYAKPSMEKSMLECRRFPPVTTAFPIGMNANGPIIHRIMGFHLTMPDWSCGEFKVRLVGLQ